MRARGDDPRNRNRVLFKLAPFIRAIIFLLQASNIENQSRRRSRILRDFHEYKIVDFEMNDGLLNK